MEKLSYVTYGRNEEAEAEIRDRKVLFIDNDVEMALLSMDDCLEVVEDAYREFGLGRATASRALHQVPRPEGQGWFNFAPMISGIAKQRVLAIRMFSSISVAAGDRGESYCATPGKFCGLIFLFSTQDGAPLAILHDGHIQHMRVGATGGLSAKYMARQDASTLGILGSAGMASTHAWAIAKVRPIKKIKVYSPNPEHRKAFAERIGEDLGIEVISVDEPKKVVQGSDIVASCTNSLVPVLPGEWLEEGMHVLSVTNSQLDDDVLRRCQRYVYSRPPTSEHYVAASPEQRPAGMRHYVGEDWPKRERRLMADEKRAFLSDVILGKAVGRANDSEITCFTSHGIPIQFAATAHKVYQLAREKGVGRELPLSWFLQDIRH